MAWSYELRASDNRLVELRGGFASKKEAEDAAQGAKRMIQSFDFAAKENLRIVTKDETGE